MPHRSITKCCTLIFHHGQLCKSKKTTTAATTTTTTTTTTTKTTTTTPTPTTTTKTTDVYRHKHNDDILPYRYQRKTFRESDFSENKFIISSKSHCEGWISSIPVFPRVCVCRVLDLYCGELLKNLPKKLCEKPTSLVQVYLEIYNF